VADVAGHFADAKQNARFPSRAENTEGYFLSRAAMEWLAGHYLGDAKHGADWRVWSNSASTGHEGAVCTENPIRVDGVTESPKLAE
jgi:hypothetical protein